MNTPVTVTLSPLQVGSLQRYKFTRSELVEKVLLGPDIEIDLNMLQVKSARELVEVFISTK
jgi:hypothetical protein